MSSATRLALLEGVAVAADQIGPERPGGFIPRAFVPLAWVCLVLMAAAGMHERMLERESAAPRTHTSLRATKIAYAASPNRTAAP